MAIVSVVDCGAALELPEHPAFMSLPLLQIDQQDKTFNLTMTIRQFFAQTALMTFRVGKKFENN